MSLRWIHENLEPPNVDEECSDIDDSCSSDDSLDSDVAAENDNRVNNNCDDANDKARQKREPLRNGGARVSFDQAGNPKIEAQNGDKHPSPCLSWDQIDSNGLIFDTQYVKLFCRTGYFIGITPSARVQGYPGDRADDAHVRLIVCPVSHGVVRLQSAETGHYLAFNATGHLYGEPKMNKDNTKWEQWKIGDYDAFRSQKYAEASWWLGVKKNGRHKPGPKTAWGQKAIQFLSVQLS